MIVLIPIKVYNLKIILIIMRGYRKCKYSQWFFFLIPILIILGISLLLHFNYLYASTSERGINSFFFNLKIAAIDLKNIIYTQLTTSPIDIETIDIPIFKLYVRGEKIDKLNSNLPKADYFGITHVSRDYVAGNLIYKNITYPSRVRYRGDNYFHWRFPKKSWRIKLSDKKIFNGSNKFNFINPKFDSHMNTQLSYYMADKMSLLSPRSYYVTIFLNDINTGVYYYTDQIDETFLRMKNKLPGDVYYGEIEDAFNYLFNNSDYWEIVATKDGDENRAKGEFDFFINNVNEKNINEKGLIKFYKFFNRYIGEDYIEFDALTALLNSPQPDQFHNQKFYLNPSNAKFEPIVWDLTPLLDKDLELSLNYFNNPLILKMHLIPEFVNKRNKIIYDYIEGNLSEENLIKIINQWEKQIEYEMTHDKLKDAKSKPHTLTTKKWREAVENLRENIKERHNFLRDSFNQVNVTIYVTEEKIILDVNGESAVKLEAKNLGVGNNEILYPGRKINYDKLDWMDIFNNTLGYTPLRYEYILKDNFKTSDIKLINSVTGKEIIPEIKYTNQLPKLDKADSIHPWVLQKTEKEGKLIIIDKDVVFTKDLVIGKKDKLVIKPGVKIKLDKGVSIISYGQIVAEGTKSNPIIITKNGDAPWGSIVMQGIDKEYSKQNYFKHCYIDGGSGINYEHVEYTGQVSIYNSVAYFENCKFSKNEIEDDNLNAKHSYVEIINSEFIDSPYDAIDFDISEGKIINTKITDSGNDGIDLMTSHVLVDGNEIIRARDKAISIGEASNPIITNNKISDSNIAIAIKDMSDPIVANNQIESNNVAIAAYHKNWRYEYGGRGKIYKNSLSSNTKDYSIDEYSSEIETDSGKIKFEDSKLNILNETLKD